MRNPTPAEKVSIAARVRAKFANLVPWPSLLSLDSRLSIVEGELEVSRTQAAPAPQVHPAIAALVKQQMRSQRITRLASDAVDQLPDGFDERKELLRQNVQLFESCEDLRNQIAYLKWQLEQATQSQEAA